MIVVGLVRRRPSATAPVAESAEYGVKPRASARPPSSCCLLRAFSSGCSALTGVEAISNGVPAFRTPKVKNAQRTLVLMGSIAIVLFVGLSRSPSSREVHYAENACHLIGFANCEGQPQRSLIAQIASAVFGNNSVLCSIVIQAATAAVLLLAANTAFNGFPLLGSVLANDSYAPKSLLTRGDRLVFSNGVIVLGLFATLILVVYQANLTQLIQLYIIGVFVSFTLGQTGMVKHWWGMLQEGCSDRGAVWRGLAINAFGAFLTAVVLIVVTITKFTHGAWLVFAIMPILYIADAGRQPLLPRREQGDRGRRDNDLRIARATTPSCSSAACRSPCSRPSTTRSRRSTTASRPCTSRSTTSRRCPREGLAGDEHRRAPQDHRLALPRRRGAALPVHREATRACTAPRS